MGLNIMIHAYGFYDVILHVQLCTKFGLACLS
jgi:hypothetical protein